MKILITGPTGFIGKHLIDNLMKENHTVVAIEKEGADTSFLDLHHIRYAFYKKSYTELYEFMQAEQPDGIIHLASLFLASHQSDQIQDLVDSNVLFPTHLMEAAANANIKWFINTGTFWQHYQNADFSPVNLYAATKQAFEDLAKYYYETRSINFATLQLSDTFGPGDIRPKIFNLWLRVAATGEVLEMSKGDQLIDISYIDNVIDGFVTLMNLMQADHEKTHCGKVYALKAEKRYSLRELSQLFVKVTNCFLNIEWGKKEYREREVMIPWETGITIPGWSPKVSLEEGIERFYSNYKKTER